MTSVPKPLKFLRPHHIDLQALYEIWSPSKDKVSFTASVKILWRLTGFHACNDIFWHAAPRDLALSSVFCLPSSIKLSSCRPWHMIRINRMAIILYYPQIPLATHSSRAFPFCLPLAHRCSYAFWFWSSSCWTWYLWLDLKNQVWLQC